MIYPKFLRRNDVIGITAPSAGVGHKEASFNKSINEFIKRGYLIRETNNVRTDNIRSSTDIIRGTEFNSLVSDDEVKAIIAASGGDFNLEMLPFINEYALIKKPKWIAGSSDPTNILYYVTTKLDIATIYGFNAGSFDKDDRYPFQKSSFEILKGNIISQNSFKYFDSNNNFSVDEIKLNGEVNWQLVMPGKSEIIDKYSPRGSQTLEVTGRLIGGCIDCISKLIGTPFDGTGDFVDRYKDKIWFFDNFAMNALDLYLTMLQMKYCGYFKGTKAVIFGRTMFPSDKDIVYIDLLKKVFDIPFIWNADIGHVKPCFTIINGSIGTLKCVQGKGELNQELQ